jgi:flagellar protein FlgJ
MGGYLGVNEGIGISGMRGSSVAMNASRERVLKAAQLELGHVQVDAKTMRQIDQTAQEFESVFLSQMLEYAFADISSNPLAAEGTSSFADDTYRSMMLSEYGKKMSQAGGIGIADHVKRAMLQAQEVSHVVR